MNAPIYPMEENQEYNEEYVDSDAETVPYSENDSDEFEDDITAPLSDDESDDDIIHK